MSAHAHAEPVGGSLFTLPSKVLMVIAAVGLSVIGIRFLTGLGTVTALNDGYTWGLWITWDVVTGTALASGGYAMALLVYAFNRGQYHPLVRPALLTGALGYTLALFGVLIDIGRWWNVYNMVKVWEWNMSSVLLEVALCVMAYTLVLWIELSPAFLETARDSSWPRLAKASARILPVLDKALVVVLAFGILLPTMHQSSLGSLLLIAVSKLHPLWHTPLLPLLFLLSTLAMGYAAVVFEASLSSLAFGRPRETDLLGRIGRLISGLLFAYLAIRYVDLGLRGRLALVGRMDRYAVMFLVETLLFLLPAIMLLGPKARSGAGTLFRAAVLMMTAGGLYRFDAYLIAFNPGPGWSYFPSVTEMLGTLGLVAVEILAYVAIVKKFPILAGGAARPASPRQAVANVRFAPKPAIAFTPGAAGSHARRGALE